MNHSRKCHDCGSIAEHSSNVAPEVFCRWCGSPDTRPVKFSSGLIDSLESMTARFTEHLLNDDPEARPGFSADELEAMKKGVERDSVNVFTPENLVATPPVNELEHCRRLAPKYAAEVEVRLMDDSRCDLVTHDCAIEVDWADKWKEAIGQAGLYAILLDKAPAVLLLVRPGDSKMHILRAKMVCERFGIKLFLEST